MNLRTMAPTTFRFISPRLACGLCIVAFLAPACTRRPEGVIFSTAGHAHDGPRSQPQASPAAVTPTASDPVPGPGSPPAAPSPAPSADPPTPAPGLREVFPHVRLDAAARLVEFDGYVPIDTHDPETPLVYLETIVCTPDTRPHESLVATDAKPSHIHAALLAAGLQPGEPGAVVMDAGTLRRTPPRGPPVEVTVAHRNDAGAEVPVSPADWIINAVSGERLGVEPAASPPRWVFSGSRFVTVKGAEFYDADGSGVIVGLHTFGAEVIAFASVMSPEASLEEPEWIADGKSVPPMGTPVIVRLRSP